MTSDERSATFQWFIQDFSTADKCLSLTNSIDPRSMNICNEKAKLISFINENIYL